MKIPPTRWCARIGATLAVLLASGTSLAGDTDAADIAEASPEPYSLVAGDALGLVVFSPAGREDRRESPPSSQAAAAVPAKRAPADDE
jgi:hypothetical protein